MGRGFGERGGDEEGRAMIDLGLSLKDVSFIMR